MKVRFNSLKERSPDVDNGLKVLYGPGRRTAFRLRWYLILALVGSPLVWACSRLLLGAVVLEAPAQLSLTNLEVRAFDSGRVQDLPVRAGTPVQPGQVLLRLDNPQWQLRLQQLQPLNSGGHEAKDRAALALQGRSIDLQGRTVDLYRGLHSAGGISSAELLQAEFQLNSQRLAQLDLGRRLNQEQYQLNGAPIELQRAEQERRWLASRLRQLTYKASEPGRVTEVNVQPGENVGPGTLLMRIEQADPPTLWIYVQPQAGVFAQAGSRVDVLMPDGSWRAAEVVQQADLARRLPTGLPRGTAADEMALRVPARFLEPLPAQWRVDQLPLRVRFPQRWPSLWPPKSA